MNETATDNKKTIKEIAEMWREYKRPFVKISTYGAYMQNLQNHIIPYFGESYEIEENQVQKFVLDKINSGLSVKTVQDLLVVLKLVVKFGFKYGWINSRAEWQIDYPTDNTSKEIEVLSVANHKKILNYAKENFTFRNLGIYITLTTGVRIGEICGLKWGDIDIINGTISIERIVERVHFVESRYTKVMIGAPKTRNSIRKIPMCKELLDMVKPLKKVVKDDFYVLTNGPEPTEPHVYRNYYNRLMEQLGIPRIKYHGLRHSFATRCIESECDYKTVSVLLGHADISTTLNLYVHPNAEQKKKVVAKMFKSLGK